MPDHLSDFAILICASRFVDPKYKYPEELHDLPVVHSVTDCKGKRVFDLRLGTF
ncbi:hypothetical protein D3C85_1419820 [compost metagenome]